MNSLMAFEMLRSWAMLANLAVMGLVGSAAFVAVPGSRQNARASIRVRRR
jgi:hypothetical protein